MHSKKEDTLYLWLNPRSIHYNLKIWNVVKDMMYPYMTLADETEIVHSQIIEKDGIKKVIVNFERPTENGGIQIA